MAKAMSLGVMESKRSFFGKNSRDGIGHLSRHMGDQGVAGLALVECDECLLMAGADHQIGFVVAEALTAIDNGGALLDRHLVGDSAASVAATITLSAGLLATRGAVQCATSAPVGVDALIDGFVANAGLPARLEIAGNLFGTP